MSISEKCRKFYVNFYKYREKILGKFKDVGGQIVSCKFFKVSMKFQEKFTHILRKFSISFRKILHKILIIISITESYLNLNFLKISLYFSLVL